MAVPKRRQTRAKSKMRRAQHDKVTPVNLAPCKNCGEPVLPHRVCASCGHYKGVKVVTTKLAPLPYAASTPASASPGSGVFAWSGPATADLLY